MNVRVQIQVVSEEEAAARSAMAAAIEEIRRMESLLSESRPQSDISRLNQAAGREPVEISAEVSQALSRGLEVAKITGGAFSLTSAALASLWDFAAHDGPRTLPTPERLRERLALIDDSKLVLDRATRSARLVDAGMAVGTSGIAKGCAIHRALTVLKKRGLTSALVFVGGDIGVSGTKGDKPWIIGIQDPRASGFFAVIPVQDQSLATRGDYERYFELQGERYHDILDPRSGLPARGCRSVTILADDAVTADALSTAVFVMGPEEGLRLVESTDGIEAIIVDASNEISMSSGLKNRLRVVRPPSEQGNPDTPGKKENE
jgi:thiamine biosynthesis lipoprotein